MRVLLMVCVLVVLGTSPGFAQQAKPAKKPVVPRWTDQSGKYMLDAEPVAISDDGSRLYLVEYRGYYLDLPIGELSEESRAQLEAIQKDPNTAVPKYSELPETIDVQTRSVQAGMIRVFTAADYQPETRLQPDQRSFGELPVLKAPAPPQAPEEGTIELPVMLRNYALETVHTPDGKTLLIHKHDRFSPVLPGNQTGAEMRCAVIDMTRAFVVSTHSLPGVNVVRALSPGGQRVLVGYGAGSREEGVLAIYRRQQQNLILEAKFLPASGLPRNMRGQPNEVGFLDDHLLYLQDSMGALTIWDVDTLTVKLRYTGIYPLMTQVFHGPDRTYLAFRKIDAVCMLDGKELKLVWQRAYAIPTSARSFLSPSGSRFALTDDFFRRNVISMHDVQSFADQGVMYRPSIELYGNLPFTNPANFNPLLSLRAGSEWVDERYFRHNRFVYDVDLLVPVLQLANASQAVIGGREYYLVGPHHQEPSLKRALRMTPSDDMDMELTHLAWRPITQLLEQQHTTLANDPGQLLLERPTALRVDLAGIQDPEMKSQVLAALEEILARDGHFVAAENEPASLTLSASVVDQRIGRSVPVPGNPKTFEDKSFVLQGIQLSLCQGEQLLWRESVSRNDHSRMSAETLQPGHDGVVAPDLTLLKGVRLPRRLVVNVMHSSGNSSR